MVAEWGLNISAFVFSVCCCIDELAEVFFFLFEELCFIYFALLLTPLQTKPSPKIQQKKHLPQPR
jgi:hypothetical protein